MKNKHIGSTFDSLLDEQGIRESVDRGARENLVVDDLQQVVDDYAAGGGTSEEFSAAFSRAQHISGWTDADIFEGLNISRPTVRRWACGESAPHPLGRLPALKWFVSEARRRAGLEKT